jgi:hypothetical protein
MESALVILPLLAMVAVVVDTAWAVYAKAPLQRTVRMGVRTGITLTSSQMATGACLTDTVKIGEHHASFGPELSRHRLDAADLQVENRGGQQSGYELSGLKSV